MRLTDMFAEGDWADVVEGSGINIDTRALHAHLKKHGWRLSRSSGSHDVFAHDQAEHIIPVPRHRQLKLPLIKSIIKQSILDKETEKLHEMSDEHLVSYFNNINNESAEPGVAEEAENKDMTGQTCEKCKRGKYQETSIHDDMDGVLHCTKCGTKVDRWRAYKEPGVAEGTEFGAYYYEQLAQKVFDQYPDLNNEDNVLNFGYAMAKEELGKRANGIFRDEDFPSDFVSAYFWLKKQKQGVAKGHSNEGISMNQDDKQLDELNFFKTAPAAPKKFTSRVGTLPGQQDMTYRKNGETFTLHLEGDTFQLISNGQVVQSFNAPERDVQAHLAKEGYFLVKAPMTPTKTSSLGGPNWFKEGEEDEDDYDNEYQNMVQRMAKKASDQERERGPVDIADLARKLRAISQKDQD